MFDKDENIVLKIPFTGFPKPTVSWSRAGEELKVGTSRSHRLLDKRFTHPCHSMGEEKRYIKSGETVGK